MSKGRVQREGPKGGSNGRVHQGAGPGVGPGQGPKGGFVRGPGGGSRGRCVGGSVPGPGAGVGQLGGVSSREGSRVGPTVDPGAGSEVGPEVAILVQAGPGWDSLAGPRTDPRLCAGGGYPAVVLSGYECRSSSRSMVGCNFWAVSFADVNECLIRNGGCAQVCVNRPGSFVCRCGDGFELNVDNRTCDGTWT